MPEYDRPPVVTISFTDRCNLECAHCYSECGRRDPGHELTTEQWLDFVDYAVANDFIAAYFEGGEPLQRPDFATVLKRASRSMMTWLRTHATLIDEDMAGRLRAAGLGGAFVELMGARASTHEAGTGVAGSFAATCRGIENLLAARIDTRSVIILTRRTAPELNDLLRLAADLGVAQVSVLRLYPIGRAKRLWGELSLSLDDQMAALAAVKPPSGVQVAHSWHPNDKNCCWSSVAVNAYGNSIGCPYLREFVRYGNVTSIPLLDGWHTDPLYRRLRAGHVDHSCGACETREGTRGGCRATAFAFAGRWDAPDPFCPDMNRGTNLQILPGWLLELPDPQTSYPARGPLPSPPRPKALPPCDPAPGRYRVSAGTRSAKCPSATSAWSIRRRGPPCTAYRMKRGSSCANASAGRGRSSSGAMSSRRLRPASATRTPRSTCSKASRTWRPRVSSNAFHKEVPPLPRGRLRFT